MSVGGMGEGLGRGVYGVVCAGLLAGAEPSWGPCDGGASQLFQPSSGSRHLVNDGRSRSWNQSRSRSRTGARAGARAGAGAVRSAGEPWMCVCTASCGNSWVCLADLDIGNTHWCLLLCQVAKFCQEEFGFL